jgi:hypothetical protein
MHDFELRMSKMEMVLGCTAGYHKSLELEPSQLVAQLVAQLYYSVPL